MLYYSTLVPKYYNTIVLCNEIGHSCFSGVNVCKYQGTKVFKYHSTTVLWYLNTIYDCPLKNIPKNWCLQRQLNNIELYV